MLACSLCCELCPSPYADCRYTCLQMLSVDDDVRYCGGEPLHLSRVGKRITVLRSVLA